MEFHIIIPSRPGKIVPCIFGLKKLNAKYPEFEKGDEALYFQAMLTLKDKNNKEDAKKIFNLFCLKYSDSKYYEEVQKILKELK